ncbi:hypothetical protein Pfo_000420 [Paulownia fortunei]|nr:hypothetical protein Pfo_000420 [Paulownia fortunei]
MESSDSAKTPQKAGGRKGGLRTMPFVIGKLHFLMYSAFEKIAGYGLQPNMILYLITAYHFSAASATSTLFIWGAISNFMPILGAFLSDSYFGRFLVISMATVTNLVVSSFYLMMIALS